MTPAHSRRASPLVLWRSYGFGLLLLALACLMAIKPAQAQLRVDISGTGATQYLSLIHISGNRSGQDSGRVRA